MEPYLHSPSLYDAYLSISIRRMNYEVLAKNTPKCDPETSSPAIRRGSTYRNVFMSCCENSVNSESSKI
jgi:hypothetical protein